MSRFGWVHRSIAEKAIAECGAINKFHELVKGYGGSICFKF